MAVHARPWASRQEDTCNSRRSLCAWATSARAGRTRARTSATSAPWARSIEATGGEPLNPPVVVADGNVYRIVDGERRYRALSSIYGEDREVSGAGGGEHGRGQRARGHARHRRQAPADRGRARTRRAADARAGRRRAAHRAREPRHRRADPRRAQASRSHRRRRAGDAGAARGRERLRRREGRRGGPRRR